MAHNDEIDKTTGEIIVRCVHCNSVVDPTEFTTNDKGEKEQYCRECAKYELAEWEERCNSTEFYEGY